MYANAILLLNFEILTSHHDLKSWFQLGVWVKLCIFFWVINTIHI